jgi:hypothetical protein
MMSMNCEARNPKFEVQVGLQMPCPPMALEPGDVRGVVLLRFSRFELLSHFALRTSDFPGDHGHEQ